VLLMPFGWEAVGLVPMGWGVDLVNDLALAIAGWPGSVVKVRAFPAEALGIMTVGGLWLAIWRGRWRLWGLLPIAGGILIALAARPPDLLVSADGQLMAINAGDRGLVVSSASGSKLVAQSWAARFAEDRAGDFAEASGDGSLDLTCDRLGCRYRLAGRIIALSKDARSLADDCAEADILVSAVPVRGRCPHPAVTIDRFRLWRAGAHVLWIDETEIVVESVRDRRGVRPWAPAPEERRASPNTSAAARSGAPAP
jgi:competence protein ComEC